MPKYQIILLFKYLSIQVLHSYQFHYQISSVTVGTYISIKLNCRTTSLSYLSEAVLVFFKKLPSTPSDSVYLQPTYLQPTTLYCPINKKVRPLDFEAICCSTYWWKKQNEAALAKAWKCFLLSSHRHSWLAGLNCKRTVLVAQLVEQLLPILEVCSSNPVIGKNLNWTFTVNCIEKTKIKEKRGREWPIFSKFAVL